MSVWPHLHWPFVFSRIFWNLCCNASRHMGIWERPTWRSPDYPRRLLLLHPWRKASQKFNIYLFYEEEKIIHAYIHTFFCISMTRHLFWRSDMLHMAGNVTGQRQMQLIDWKVDRIRFRDIQCRKWSFPSFSLYVSIPHRHRGYGGNNTDQTVTKTWSQWKVHLHFWLMQGKSKHIMLLHIARLS